MSLSFVVKKSKKERKEQMKRTKKVILTCLLVLGTLITVNSVDAKEFASINELLNLFPNEIKVSGKSNDYAQNLYYTDENVEKIITDNVSYVKEEYACGDRTCSDDNILIGGKKYYIVHYQTNVYDYSIKLYERKYHGSCYGDECDNWGQDPITSTKVIKMVFDDSDKYNKADADYVKKAVKNLNRYYFMSYSLYNDADSETHIFYDTYVKNSLNDKSLTVKTSTAGGYGDGDYTAEVKVITVYKNGIPYETLEGGLIAFNFVIVPYNTPDTDAAYIKAAEAMVKKIWNKFTVTKITKLTDKNIFSVEDRYIPMSMYKVSLAGGDCEAGHECFARVMIKKNSQTKIMDGVIMDDVLGLEVNGQALSSTNNTYKEMAKTATNKGYGKPIKAINFTINDGKLNSKANLVIDVGASYKGQKILVVSKNGNSYETINETVRSDGKVYVSVSSLSSLMISAISNTPITGVKVNPTTLTIATGKAYKIGATISPSNTTQSKVLTWSSSNTKIATVDKNGVVKGIKKGTATITVKTSNGKTATVKVTVVNPVKIKSVKLNKKTLKLELNKSTTVKATINPSNTTDSKTLTWSTSNKKVATVDKNGKITAVGAGKATITVKTSNGKKATVKVTVSKINAKKATITAIKNQVQTGKSLKPAVQVKLNGKVLRNGKDYTVTYKNNKKAGKATVTVKFKGNYTGSKTGSFLIIPSKVNIKNPSTAKKSITVKYSKVSGAKSYQVAYRLKGTNKWSYTTKSKISKLTSGKEYEVMIRAGIKSGSKTLYGAWSNTKVIKVK